ncbi:Ribonuclease P protein component [Labilithrix luteola]|uniref:Ribonuclease P protein component n=1 Tax=Labilithrix luteola TaxID=1391654 RepID=A0A0K1PYH7_9BACT|nr:Ribonuclease P protein component [Labilithrix luteola]
MRTATPHFVLLVTASPARTTRRRSDAERNASDSPGSLGHARLGIVVTKKIGSAPVRNRIKRLCRECFRLWPDFLPDGVDLVVIARNGAGELGLADVQAEWSRARSAVLKRCAAVLRGAIAQKGAESAT